MLKKMRTAPGTPPRRQRGAAAVEFALIALVFFTLLLGIIEFGRLLYLWNTTQEVTRYAAREAVVRWTDEKEAIKREAIFQGGTSGTVALPAGPELTNAAISIRYLSSCIDPTTGERMEAAPASPENNLEECIEESCSCIRFVEASVSGVTYIPMAGLFSWWDIAVPASTVVMPAESMGYRP